MYLESCHDHGLVWLTLSSIQSPERSAPGLGRTDLKQHLDRTLDESLYGSYATNGFGSGARNGGFEQELQRLPDRVSVPIPREVNLRAVSSFWHERIVVSS